MKGVWLIGLLTACSSSLPPELSALERSVEAYEEGRQALDRGELKLALQSFESAAAAKGAEDPVLLGWQAKVLMAEESYDQARERLDKALKLDESLSSARYARALCALKLGDIEGAGADLRTVISAGALSSYEVASDPQIKPFVKQLDFLPSQPFALRFDTPQALAFWGSEVTTTLVESGLHRELSLSAPDAHGPVRLVRMEEEARPGQGANPPEIHMKWHWRVVGRGPIVWGPIGVTVSGTTLQTEAATGMAGAPSHKPVEDARPIEYTLASTLLDGRELPSAWRTAEGVFVAHPRDHRVVVEPQLQVETQWIHLQEDDKDRVVHRYPAEVVSVRVGLPGKEKTELVIDSGEP